ncbi:MAG: MBL fold metallo-hydrolase [Myxococcales bacterium]|nr:MBL fold metallo-hydrolase [Myxococcales bacterium]MCB9705295.1 MBL fold metallo-hydrolase [Myxococcales bacterium]
MSKPPTLSFFGATGTVTGSRYLLSHRRARAMIDCGLFQGFKQLRLRNWSPPPIAPAAITSMALTHAHIDHSGYLPIIVRDGYRGRVLCTGGTAELCALLLPDSGRLQELDAEYANRKGFSKHRPALPLYGEADAMEAVARLKEVAFDTPRELDDDMEIRFIRAGHILGASSIHLRYRGGSILFSGDVGRPDDPLMRAPEPRQASDYLVVESTYGDRKHDRTPPEEALADVINRTHERGGSVIIPAFAVGRTQLILLLVDRLKAARKIPDLPVFLDSPMAIAATSTFYRHRDTHRLSEKECERMCNASRYIRDAEDSKALDTGDKPMILISASGMATGGRIVHHLKALAPDPRNTILFTGFQAGGTRGAAMVGGAKQIKIHGQYVAVNAEVAALEMLSAHADADELIAWLRTCDDKPRHTFVTHGEPAASDALRRRIQEELGWAVSVPDYRDEVALL